MNETTLQYIDPFSILVVDASGVLKRIFCPFKVVSAFIDDDHQEYLVEMVRKNPDNEVLYVIGGQIWSHSSFIIQ